MIRQAISCDVCGTEKRQTNHWFVAFEQAGELRLGGWTSRNRARPNSKHLCGQTCVHKLVDEYMAQIVASKPLRAVDDSPAIDETQDDPIEYQDQPLHAQLAATTAAPTRPAPRAPITIPALRPAKKPAARERNIAALDEDSTDRLTARSESFHSQNRFDVDSDSRTLDRTSDRSLTTEYDFELDQECSARLITTPEPTVARHRPQVEPQRPIPQSTLHPSAPRPALIAAPKSTDRSIIELPLTEEAPSFSSRKWRTEAWERERARELRAANNTPASIVSRLRLN
jgi:hypothetical protein